MNNFDIKGLSGAVLPAAGMHCTIAGYFYYRTSDERNGKQLPACYIAGPCGDTSVNVELPSAVGEMVLDGDETFGTLVGGPFEYFGLAGQFEGLLIRDGDALKLMNIEHVMLSKGELSQVFRLPGPA